MKKYCCLLFTLLFCLSHIKLPAQHLNTSDLINIWHDDGLGQTIKAEGTYDELIRKFSGVQFLKRMDSLRVYLEDHDDPRVWIRTAIYEVVGRRKMETPVKPIYIANLKTAMTKAGLLKDDQLLSEIFTIYADSYVNDDMRNRLFYTLKGIDYQRKIGLQYFPHSYLRFVTISRAMYGTRDYTEAISYGRECLNIMKSPDRDPENYILQLDLIGASYKHLGNADSTLYYYQEIQRVLEGYQMPDAAFKEIWTGVAHGGIAQGLVLKGDYDSAIPLLHRNIESSKSHAEWGDAAMAADALAHVRFKQGKYPDALENWRAAFDWSVQGAALGTLITASAGLRKIFERQHAMDSAYRYQGLYHYYMDSLQKQINDCRLSDLKAQIGFETVQASLVRAKLIIDRQHQIRNLILGGVGILGMISIFLYNRYRLKQALQWQILERKNKIAAMEISRAKEQVAMFADNLREKETLIHQLQHQQPDAVSIEEITQRLKRFSLVTDDAWTKFKGEFVTAYPDFYPRLYKVLHKMTPAEERLTALMYLRLSNQLIADMLGISKESVARSKRRLNQRMLLPPDVSLENFLFAEEGQYI